MRIDEDSRRQDIAEVVAIAAHHSKATDLHPNAVEVTQVHLPNNIPSNQLPLYKHPMEAGR
jgi:hypothetical protein